jgi:hypothetical protein
LIIPGALASKDINAKVRSHFIQFFFHFLLSARFLFWFMGF